MTDRDGRRAWQAQRLPRRSLDLGDLAEAGRETGATDAGLGEGPPEEAPGGVGARSTHGRSAAASDSETTGNRNREPQDSSLSSVCETLLDPSGAKAEDATYGTRS